MDKELPVLISVYNQPEAALIRSALEARDIEVFLQDENLMMMAPHYGALTKGIKVRVPADQLEAAQAILDGLPLDTEFDGEVENGESVS